MDDKHDKVQPMADAPAEESVIDSPGGRPTKLTATLQERFLEAMRAGNHRETAALHAGISAATMYRWMSDPREPYLAFREAVEAAEATAEMALVAAITKRTPEDPRLAMEFLARRHPSRWAPVRATAIDGSKADGQRDSASYIQRGIDPGVRHSYRQLAPFERWVKIATARASDNSEEERRLRSTCPPQDAAELQRLEIAALLAMNVAAICWVMVSGRIATAAALSLGGMLINELYGYRDETGTRGEIGRGLSPLANRLVNVFEDPSFPSVADAVKELATLWKGICGVAKHLGLGDPAVLIAVHPHLAEELRERRAELDESEADPEMAVTWTEFLLDYWRSA